jgi:hypothetical protein
MGYVSSTGREKTTAGTSEWQTASAAGVASSGKK